MIEQTKLRKESNWAKRLCAIVTSIFCGCFFILGALQGGAAYRKAENGHWTPTYAKVDITPLLLKGERTEEEYATLYAQTGLTKLGVDGLLERGEIVRILNIQDAYFNEYTITTKSFAPYTYTRKIGGEAEFALLEDGDIFISGSAFTSWFQYGHSGIVVDGEKEMVLDSVTIGYDSAVSTIRSFKRHARFMILRPKADEKTRRAVAKYALENLKGKPYDVAVGILSPKAAEEVKGTHCSHLVWYAYHQFGIDLDSSGGAIVTPRDLANATELELVQTFGFHPQTLWN